MTTLSRVLGARSFALIAHGDQLYGKGPLALPYEYHLTKVLGVWERLDNAERAAILASYPGLTDEMVRIAAWLHDLIEDTSETFEIVARRFGAMVAMLVYAVSDVPKEVLIELGVKPNRHGRKWGTPQFPGPMRRIPMVRGAVVIKLLNRIANVEASIAAVEKLENPTRAKIRDKLGMYRKEQVDFRTTLRVPGESVPLWDHLDSLSQRVEELSA
jgi:(p)ppGpp synthase/HD superfamily hydrolase